MKCKLTRVATRLTLLLLALVTAAALAAGVFSRARRGPQAVPLPAPAPGMTAREAGPHPEEDATSPDPAPVRRGAHREADPVLVVVVAQYPGASAEEVERQVTIPLEVTLAGMPGLKYTRTKSMFGLSHLRNQFEYGHDYEKARQEVINRLSILSHPLPPGVTPQLSPESPAGDILRYTLEGPRGAQGRDVYTPSDLKALQDWVLEREFRRLPGVADVSSSGGTVKHYEVHPDPERLRRYGITLQQLANALAEGNSNLGGDYVLQGRTALAVRGVGLFGGGQDPVQQVLGLKDPRTAAARLRAEEERRLREIRRLVIASVNRVPVRVEDVVEGGRLAPGEERSRQGVVVGHEPRLGKVRPRRAGEPDEDETVQGAVFLRPGEDPQQVLRRVKARVRELNDHPGTLLPGARIEPFYERTGHEGAPAPGAEGGNLWVEAAFPVNASLEEVSDRMRTARKLLLGYPEVRAVVSQIGGSEDGTDPAGFESARSAVLLRPEKDWPAGPGRDRPRTRAELMDEMEAALTRALAGVDWDVTPQRRDDFRDVFVAAPGEGLLKVFGPDIDGLEQRAELARQGLAGSEGIGGVRIRHTRSRANLEFRIDRDKCARWGVSVADVNMVLGAAVGGQRVTQVVEGEKVYPLILRWPQRLRRTEASILDIPVDAVDIAPQPGGGEKLIPPPAGVPAGVPRIRLRDLVSPLGADGQPDPQGRFVRPGAAAIYREQGQRLIAIRFRVGGRDGARAVAVARKKLAPLFKAPYRAEWTGGPPP
jgi:Cu/Ag efflux pump CusA